MDYLNVARYRLLPRRFCLTRRQKFATLLFGLVFMYTWIVLTHVDDTGYHDSNRLIPSFIKSQPAKNHRLIYLNDKLSLEKPKSKIRQSDHIAQNLFQAQNLSLLSHTPNLGYPIFPSDLLDPDMDDRILFQMSYLPTSVIRKRQQGTVQSKIVHFYSTNRKTANLSLCPVYECVFNHGLVGWQKADLVVLHDGDLPMEPRPMGQPWMLSVLESPFHTTQLNFAGKDRMINFTASYRRDSTLVTPYYKYVSFEDKNPMTPTNPVDYAKGKTKLIAWFVSNCQSTAPRKEYVNELRKFIPVDIYGSCGNLSCPNNSPECFDIIEKDYKFYLSFENSLCKDYITEKYFLNALMHKSIPIVMGASKREYEHVSPRHAFIHVNDYKSPEILAQYLNYLNQNDTAYNMYFEWRQNAILDFNTFSDCRICMLVHELEHITPVWYEDVEQWWLGGCQHREPVPMHE